MESDPKQVLVVRKDLNMRKCKIAAQASHASLGAILNLTTRVSADGLHLDLSQNPALKSWITGSFKKICVSVNSEDELKSIYQQAEDAGLIACLITDSGLTEFRGVPTLTTCAIGPAYPEDVDPITSHLPLL
jgi:PTH2 family peptidyl-tRNA hydrolase